MTHKILSSGSIDILIHIADFGSDVLIKIIPNAGEGSVLIETVHRFPISFINVDKNFVSRDQAKVWCKSQRQRYFKQLTITPSDIVTDLHEPFL